MTKINIANKHCFDFLEECKKEFPNCEFIIGESRGFKDCEIIWGLPNASTLSEYKNLRWIQSIFAGVDNYVQNKDIIPNNLKLTTATGVYDLTISEYLLATHLSLYKNLHLYRDNQSECLWKGIGGIKSIKGSTVLVWGMGGIGTSYAKLVKNMGAYVIGVRRADNSKPDFVDEIYLADEVHKVLHKADMIAVTMPKTSKTDNLINKNMIDKMKDGAMIMNIGRGSIINTDDLCDALESGKLSGAGLDVVDPEPLPNDHKLWKMKNVIITPHTSGLFTYKEPLEISLELFKNNLHRYFNGEQLINEVDFDEGYRKTFNV